LRGTHNARIRTALVDAELAQALRDYASLNHGPRLFRYERQGELVNLTSRRLSAYIQEHVGEEFSAKDFRTWDGTLTAAIAFAERAPGETAAAEKRVVAAVMRRVAERLGTHRRMPCLVRLAGGDRAVCRRANDRRFPSAPFARRVRA
jgi:DNA topoisomerase-1